MLVPSRQQKNCNTVNVPFVEDCEGEDDGGGVAVAGQKLQGVRFADTPAFVSEPGDSMDLTANRELVGREDGCSREPQVEEAAPQGIQSDSCNTVQLDENLSVASSMPDIRTKYSSSSDESIGASTLTSAPGSVWEGVAGSTIEGSTILPSLGTHSETSSDKTPT